MGKDSHRECFDCEIYKEMHSKMNKGVKEYYNRCKPCFLAYKKKYNDLKKDKFKAYNATEEVRKRRRERNKVRRKTEPAYKIIESSKARIHEVLKAYKGCTSSDLLNCTRQQLLDWLEYNWSEGMTWENHGNGEGKWHIDHVVPVSFFDNTKKDEQLMCFHWSNLRPLYGAENISKWNRVDENYIKTHYDSIQTFLETDDQGYQTSAERCLWQRLELWYGNNPRHEDDDSTFEDHLKWAIRSQASSSVTDEDEEEGSETR